MYEIKTDIQSVIYFYCFFKTKYKHINTVEACYLEVHRAAENLELSVIWLVGSKAGKLSLIDVCCLMVFNATFNNISIISWRSVLLVEETRGPGENHRPVTCHWQTLSHNVAYLALIEIRTHNISGDRQIA